MENNYANVQNVTDRGLLFKLLSICFTINYIVAK